MPDDDVHQPGTRANPIRSAGALCWRRNRDHGQLELLLVRSVRWNEWSWPKGKLDAGESSPEAAVREIREETGAAVILGVPLPALRYEMPDGLHKHVELWAAQVTHEGTPTADAGEIADVAWVLADEARARLARESDSAHSHAPLDRLLDLDRQGLLEAGQLIVVRHAKAVSRGSWRGDDDAQRPLAPAGRRQTARLAEMLGCWRPDRLLSSPWARCLATLQPYEDVSGLKIEAAPEFSERSYENHPKRTARTTTSLLREPGRIVVCTHRPVLAGVVRTLTRNADRPARHHLPGSDPWLTPGQMLIAHHHGKRIFWAEIH